MQLNEYQIKAKETVVYPKIDGKGFIYPVLGLAGEVGELLNNVKKIFRDDNKRLKKERKLAVESELGDILWYVALVATEFNLSLEDIARGNIQKLAYRKRDGTLKGSGDKR